MKNIYKSLGFFAALLLIVFINACDDVEPLIEDIQYDRAFIPLELDVKVRNQMTAEVDWKVNESVDHYVLEISNDSLEFGDIIHAENVLGSDVPVSILLESEEVYSVRVKAVSSKEGQNDSKYIALAFQTEAENIFYPLTDDNLGKTEVDTWVTLSWPANSEVTHLILNPGETEERIDLTSDQIATGELTIEGLAFDTEYVVVLFNGDNPKQRGSVTFTTLPEGETLTPEDDLNEIITNANDGDVFLLEGGDYTVYQGKINIDKNIKLKGLSSSNMPVLNVQFVLTDGANSAEFNGLEMNGVYLDETEATVITDYAFQIDKDNATAVGDILVQGCYIHGYNKSLISGASGVFTLNSITFNDCIVTDVYNSGGDFIDFRASFPAAITVTNSTFVNCATENNRDFFRLDGAGKGNTFDDGAHTPVITVQYNTFYNVQNNSSGGKRFFYVRWQNSDEEIIVDNNLFYDHNGVYSSSSDTNMPTFSTNNYFNAEGLYDSTQKVYDNSSYTMEDPGFADAANNDFTLSNQTLIDNQVGDPRWR